MKPRLFVSFSGGKSSGNMAHELAANYRDQYEMVFGIANTAQENEETLIFADRCDREWNLNLVWLEAVVYHRQEKGTGHKVVTFETASRNGEPFEEIIKKYGIPNTTFPHCTRELKLNPMRSYLESIGWTRGTYISAVGIRADEPNRIRADAGQAGIVYPLAHWFPRTKSEINDWWNDQHFNLGLEDYQGNCKTCWKKSTSKLVRIAQETPEAFNFFARMEVEYPNAGCNPDPNHRRKFFRRHMSTESILILSDMAQQQMRLFDPDEDSGCSESCEAFLVPEEESIV